MGRVQLYLHPADPPVVYRFVRPGGVQDALPALRLVAYVRLVGQLVADPRANRYAVLAAPVDTGAPLSIVNEALRRYLLPGAV